MFGEDAELARELGVDGLEGAGATSDELLFVNEGRRRAAREDGEVPGAEDGEAEGGGATGEDGAGERDELGGDGVVKGEAVGGAVGATIEAAEPIGAIVREVGGSGLGEAVGEEGVEAAIEVRTGEEEAIGDGAPGGLADRSIGVVLVALDVGDRARGAVPVDVEAAAELLVVGAQVLLGGLERDEGGAKQVDAVAQAGEEAGVAGGRQARGGRVGDEPAGEAVAQRLAGGGEAKGVLEVGALGVGIVGVAGDGDLRPGLRFGQVTLELGPVAEPLLERPGVVVRERAGAELAVAGVDVGAPIEAHRGGQIAPRRRRERAEHAGEGTMREIRCLKGQVVDGAARGAKRRKISTGRIRAGPGRGRIGLKLAGDPAMSE